MTIQRIKSLFSKRRLDLPPQPSPSFGSQEISDAVAKALHNLYPRIQAINEYSAYLQESDRKINAFIEDMIEQTRHTYKITINLYIATYSLSLLAAGIGFVLLFLSVEKVAAAALCFVGMVLLLILLNRNPLKNIRYLVNNLVKLNVLYAGFSRQIHLVDATFKDLLAQSGGADIAKMEEMLGHVQVAVDEVMSSISRMMDEIQEY